jgi:cation diffusion facilitator CzcD-associated flavoprotein CzcO
MSATSINQAAGATERLEPDHEVAIIGAGLGGIGMAIALRRAGIEDFVLLERASDIGGTWRDNRYPGIAVDIPAQAYQFSYELKPDWSRVFAAGAEVKAYIDHCADRYDVRRFARLDSEVLSRVWDEPSHVWRLELPDGELTARFVISAIGAFVNPIEPAIEGLDRFRGTVLRSAAWDPSATLQGKRVAVIGTGASAVQIVPEIAKEVGRLEVYQRTPIWVGPKLDWRTPRAARWLFRRFPQVQQLVRKGVTRGVEAGLVGLVVHHQRFGWITRAGGWLAKNVWYRAQVRDPDVRRRLTPDYELGCKRPSVSNSYLRTFNRPNVELVSEPIERITATGVRTVDGRERDIDVLVLATGFRMSTDPENYRQNPVRGRHGFDLATFYAENRVRSYESVSLPGLPNHFMIFGPYGWTGGTWHVLVETASHHIVRVIEEARRREASVVEVVPHAAERWTEFAVQRLSRSLWHAGSCASSNSYYFDHHGDTPFLRPTSSRQAWRAARSFPMDDYSFGQLRDGDPPTVLAGSAAGSAPANPPPR